MNLAICHTLCDEAERALQRALARRAQEVRIIIVAIALAFLAPGQPAECADVDRCGQPCNPAHPTPCMNGCLCLSGDPGEPGVCVKLTGGD